MLKIELWIMPIREHFILGGEPLPPFSEDLVFWTPLTNGDLTDHISRISPSTDSGCTVSFDTNKNMYLLTTTGTSRSYKAALRYTSLNLGMSDGDGVTLVIVAAEKSYSGNHYSAMLSTPSVQVESQGKNPARISIVYFHSSLDTQLHRYALTCSPKIGTSNFTLKRYCDGVLKHTSQWSAIIPFTQNVVTMCQLNSSNTAYAIYVSNARIYNREMTPSEVAQL